MSPVHRADPSGVTPSANLQHHNNNTTTMTKPQTPNPPPLIIHPLHLPHKQTFILLHGRGSNAARFGPVLLTTPFPSPSPLSQTPSPTANPTQTLPTAFPHAKFIFPTAPYRRATIYKRTLITQWFDNWHLGSPPSSPSSSSTLEITTTTTKPTQRSRPAKNDWMMIDGLRETTAYLHALIREEIALLRPSAGGARDIVLGGLSQGCAVSLVGAALWDGEEGSLGAVVGLCGWLPFVEGVMAAGSGCGGGGGSVDLFERGGKDEGGLDSFERDGGEEVEEGKGFGAVEVLREMLEWESAPRGLSMLEGTPVFLGHGDEDDSVPLRLGRRSAECLGKMGLDVEWREYQGLGHWYSEEMLGDMVRFLKGRSGFSP